MQSKNTIIIVLVMFGMCGMWTLLNGNFSIVHYLLCVSEDCEITSLRLKHKCFVCIEYLFFHRVDLEVVGKRCWYLL